MNHLVILLPLQLQGTQKATAIFTNREKQRRAYKQIVSVFSCSL